MKILNYNLRTKNLEKKIKNCLKKGDFGFSIPKLNNKSLLITLEDDNQILSFIQYSLLINNDIFINGVYTNINFRKKGFSTILHNYLFSLYENNFYATALTNEYFNLSNKLKKVNLGY